MSIPEALEDNWSFHLVVPSSLYLQQSRMVLPIHNITIHRELTPITCTTEPYRSNVCTAEPYRSNVHRELMPITRTAKPYRSIVRITEPYRSNIHRELTPIICIAEPYRRELMLIIHEPYSSD
ncbi:hypothetical protein C1646_750861 [Rhizophagus diaphanus]|nr:hypothetical protein C1646_750861 [Rhizophagus diaphanus] [Rhizophagus sp. MUCL 43196]